VGRRNLRRGLGSALVLDRRGVRWRLSGPQLRWRGRWTVWISASWQWEEGAHLTCAGESDEGVVGGVVRLQELTEEGRGGGERSTC
jgi:hypothetical protein